MLLRKFRIWQRNRKDHAYADFQLSNKDWDKLEIIYEVLQVCMMLSHGLNSTV
jgi:hypothetical protein